jgi:hypothetical protein
MNNKIRNLLRMAGVKDIPAALDDLSEMAWSEVQRQLSTPCRRYLYHQRMIEKLERKADRSRVAALGSRLRWHRYFRRRAEAQCEALNACNYDKGC